MSFYEDKKLDSRDDELARKLKRAQNDPEGWIDRGTYLEKWDDETRHTLRRRKPLTLTQAQPEKPIPFRDRFKAR